MTAILQGVRILEVAEQTFVPAAAAVNQPNPARCNPTQPDKFPV